MILERLLLQRLARRDVRLYCAVGYAPYAEALPAGRHYAGSDETIMSEGHHARLRHWFARFRRRTVVVSRSVAMIDRTVALFAHYRCNGSVFSPALAG